MLPLNCIRPIFSWLYDEDYTKRTLYLLGSLSIITAIVLCVIEAGEYTFIDKIGHFLLYTFVWAIEWALIIPFVIGLVLSVISFLIHLFFDMLEKD